MNQVRCSLKERVKQAKNSRIIAVQNKTHRINALPDETPGLNGESIYVPSIQKMSPSKDIA
jgi:hypothetical protein